MNIIPVTPDTPPVVPVTPDEVPSVPTGGDAPGRVQTTTQPGPRGYSAYEIAVQNGFVGTEAEWLASLGVDLDLVDDSLVIIDPDLREQEIHDALIGFGAPEEIAAQFAATYTAYINAVVGTDQPTNVPVALGITGKLFQFFSGAFAALQGQLTDGFTLTDNTLGVLDPDTREQTIHDLLVSFGFSDGDATTITSETIATFDVVVGNDQPTDLKAAVDIIAKVLAVVVGSQSVFRTLIESLPTFGDVVTHDASEFATSEQGALADTSVQLGDQPWAQNKSGVAVSVDPVYPTQLTVESGLAMNPAGAVGYLKLPPKDTIDVGWQISFIGNNTYLSIADGDDVAIFNWDTYGFDVGGTFLIPSGSCHIVMSPMNGKTWVIYSQSSGFATSAQGALADTALQPGDKLAFNWREEAAGTWTVAVTDDILHSPSGDPVTWTLPPWYEVAEGTKYTFIGKANHYIVAPGPSGNGITDITKGYPVDHVEVDVPLSINGVLEITFKAAEWHIINRTSKYVRPEDLPSFGTIVTHDATEFDAAGAASAAQAAAIAAAASDATTKANAAQSAAATDATTKANAAQAAAIAAAAADATTKANARASAAQGALADTAVQPQALNDRKVRPAVTIPMVAGTAFYQSTDGITYNVQLPSASVVGRRYQVLIHLVALPGGVPYNRMGLYVVTGGVSTYRIGLKSVRTDGLPGAVMLDAGTVDMSGAAGVRTLTISFAPPVTGWYWAEVQVDAYTGVPTIVGNDAGGSTGLVAPAGMDTQQASYLRGLQGFFCDGGSAGALSSTAATAFTNNSATGFSTTANTARVWVWRQN